MDMQNQKCVMVMDEDLPLGVIANTAGIMGITLGKHMPETVGPDVRDKSGREHLGIIEFPVPILKADKEKIRSIREQLYQPCYSDLMVVDLSLIHICIQERAWMPGLHWPGRPRTCQD